MDRSRSCEHRSCAKVACENEYEGGAPQDVSDDRWERPVDARPKDGAPTWFVLRLLEYEFAKELVKESRDMPMGLEGWLWPETWGGAGLGECALRFLRSTAWGIAPCKQLPVRKQEVVVNTSHSSL